LAGPTAKPLAPDQAGTKDGKIVDILSPNETVTPVAVAVVLIVVPLIRLGGVVLAPSTCIRGENGRSLIEIESNFALEMNGVTKVGACGKMDRAAARRSCRVDGLIDSWSIYCRAVTLGAKRANVINGLRCSTGSGCGLGL